jgi:hypothetical protein
MKAYSSLLRCDGGEKRIADPVVDIVLVAVYVYLFGTFSGMS